MLAVVTFPLLLEPTKRYSYVFPTSAKALFPPTVPSNRAVTAGLFNT